MINERYIKDIILRIFYERYNFKLCILNWNLVFVCNEINGFVRLL